MTFVTCKICGKEFSFINSQHLVRHNISCFDYDKLYGEGSRVSKEYSESISKSSVIKARAQWNDKSSNLRTRNFSDEKSTKGKLILNYKQLCEKQSKIKSSKEQKEKQSIRMKELWKSGRMNNVSFSNSVITIVNYKNKIFRLRSSYELKLFNILIKNNFYVDNIEYESLKIPWIDDNGVSHTYFPDFYIISHYGPDLILEVKAKDFINDREVILKKEFAQRFVDNFEKETRYKIITENELDKIKEFIYD